MINLYGKLNLISGSEVPKGPLTLTTDPNLPEAIAKNYGLISDDENIKTNFKVVLRKKTTKQINTTEFLIPQELNHLEDGDIISINPKTFFTRVLFRSKSKQNSILLTERCNHYCLMCSQPPKEIDDSWILSETKELIKILPNNLSEIGFTGGEPTLYGDDFIDLMRLTKSYLPNTSIHILTNGRAFKDIDFTRKYAEIQHADMVLGIPIYSDDPVRHDYVVQSPGAFSETLKGILNLKSLGQKVEIRIVIHKQTIDRLLELCEFLARNLLFVDHVALMGLEMIGFTRANIDDLWIDPLEYKDKLSQAVLLLKNYRMNVSVYNHQRCLVNDDVMFAYRKSISDWKNEYAPECLDCKKIYECGGFFSSGIKYKYSPSIKAFT